LEGSRREADHQLASALKAVEVFGPPAATLTTLAQFVVQRDR
jgi:hypothetical protein